MKKELAPIKRDRHDPRSCTACPDGGFAIGIRNNFAVVWKCRECRKRTAQVWFRASKKYNGGVVERCLMAVKDDYYDEYEETDCDDGDANAQANLAVRRAFMASIYSGPSQHAACV